MANLLREKFGIIDRRDSEEGSAKSTLVMAVGSVALVGTIVLVAGGKLFPNIFPNFGAFASTTVTPEKTAIKARILKIVPVNFSCLAMAAYDAGDEFDSQGNIVVKGSEAAVKTHGFVHAAHANKAKVVATVCASDVKISTKHVGINVAENTVTEDVAVNIDSFITDTQFSEPDTLIVDASGGWTELLAGSGGAADAFADGVCQIVTAWNCDNGVPNPADAAVKTSREDQAKTEQYLRVTILDAIQNKCLAGDWHEFKQAIINAYTSQALLQGAQADSVHVHFVDSHGNDVTTTPDFTKKAVQALIDSGAITSTMPDVEIMNDAKPEVNCTSSVPSTTGATLTDTATVGVATK